MKDAWEPHQVRWIEINIYADLLWLRFAAYSSIHTFINKRLEWPPDGFLVIQKYSSTQSHVWPYISSCATVYLRLCLFAFVCQQSHMYMYEYMPYAHHTSMLRLSTQTGLAAWLVTWMYAMLLSVLVIVFVVPSIDNYMNQFERGGLHVCVHYCLLCPIAYPTAHVRICVYAYAIARAFNDNEKNDCTHTCIHTFISSFKC